jgi:hypothetical protein
VNRLVVRWIAQREAKQFVALHHRHHKKPSRGAIICLGCWLDDRLVGVAFIGRPPARRSRKTASGVPRGEVTRLCAEEGRENVCSKLYGRARRVMQTLGLDTSRFTYTLACEPGTSLRAAGLISDIVTAGGSWDRDGRHRTDAHPLDPKRRWLA